MDFGYTKGYYRGEISFRWTLGNAYRPVKIDEILCVFEPLSQSCDDYTVTVEKNDENTAVYITFESQNWDSFESHYKRFLRRLNACAQELDELIQTRKDVYSMLDDFIKQECPNLKY